MTEKNYSLFPENVFESMDIIRSIFILCFKMFKIGLNRKKIDTNETYQTNK